MVFRPVIVVPLGTAGDDGLVSTSTARLDRVQIHDVLHPLDGRIQIRSLVSRARRTECGGTVVRGGSGVRPRTRPAAHRLNLTEREA